MSENEEKVLNFVWKIENYSYCWHLTNDYLQSPDFEMDIFEGSSWYLKLFPRGVYPHQNHVGVHLVRMSTSEGPLGINIDFEIGFMRSKGDAVYVKEMKNRCFRKGHEFGFDNLVPREQILEIEKLELLPEDVLTVQCRIIPKGTKLKTHAEIIGRTHLELERYVFRWESKNCFSQKCDEFHTLKFFNGLQPLVLKIYWSTVDQLEYLNINFSNNDQVKVFRCKMCILDSDNSIARCILDKLIDVGENNICLINAQDILRQKNIFLPNDKLSLHCDFICSFRIQYSQIEILSFDCSFLTFSTNRETSPKVDSEKKRSCYQADIYESIKKDFETLYKEGTLSDFTLRVGNEDIKAHKAILVGRSPVFKAMLTSNMKEHLKNTVEISDMDANTARCMLTFMYSDKIKDLDWNGAKNLYIAADKYDIKKLKRICSDVLKQNLCVSNVVSTLSLANLYGDDVLKEEATEFIGEHNTEVICSTEWKDFMTEETQLAAETMRHIFMKKAKTKAGK